MTPRPAWRPKRLTLPVAQKLQKRAGYLLKPPLACAVLRGQDWRVSDVGPTRARFCSVDRYEAFMRAVLGVTATHRRCTRESSMIRSAAHPGLPVANGQTPTLSRGTMKTWPQTWGEPAGSGVGLWWMSAPCTQGR